MVTAFRMLTAVCALICCAWVPVSAQDLPDKEMRLLVAYKPGGQSDLLARKAAGIIEQNKFFPQPVIVYNLPGAGTRDALRALREAKPDGSTLLMHHNALLTMFSMGLLPWNYTEFTCVAQLTEAPMVVVVKADKPWKTLKDLLEDARKNPAVYSFALQGVGGNGHLITEKILQESGAQFKRVAYQGGGDSIAAQLGGHVDVRLSSLVESINYLKAGQFRILAVSSKERLPELPDVPTLQECGINIVFTIKNGLLGPKNMDAGVLRALEELFRRVVDSDAFKAFCAENYMRPSFLGSKEYTKAFDGDWAVFKDLGAALVKQAK